MKRVSLLVLFCLAYLMPAQAQDDLFGSAKKPSRKGVIFGVNGNLDFPGADMAKRFGTSYRLGGSILYKTTSNWMFGPKMDFIMGGKVKEDSLLANLADRYGTILDRNGDRVGVRLFERGYMIGLQVGRIINMSKKSSDNGILIMTSAGFMQHKINIFDREKTILQIQGDYRKGYDRLTNGLFLEQFVGYNYFADNGLINFHIGLDVTAGFTKGRRDYLYDVRRPDDQSRIDLLFGLRGSWYIPIFKRKSEEFFFE